VVIRILTARSRLGDLEVFGRTGYGRLRPFDLVNPGRRLHSPGRDCGDAARQLGEDNHCRTGCLCDIIDDSSLGSSGVR
jgi:hypothetical protein